MRTVGLTDTQIRDIMDLAAKNFKEKNPLSVARHSLQMYCEDNDIDAVGAMQAKETYNFQIKALAYIPTL